MTDAQRRNHLSKVSVNGNRLIEEVDINEGCLGLSNIAPTEVRDWKPSISGMQFEMLGSNDPRKLEAPISEKESNLCRDKPRSNGFTIAFREMSWDFIKTGMMGFFREFFDNSSFERILNATFLILIP